MLLPVLTAATITIIITIIIKPKKRCVASKIRNRSERVNSYGGNREGGVVPLRLALTASVINSKTSRF